jgi:histidinol-phosphatase (PHP family)
VRDFHVHSTDSDGSFLPGMVRAAERSGLDGVGIADHCVVSEREAHHDECARYGFALDLTYERRRRGIERVREDADIEYVIGSVHDVDSRSRPRPV